MSPAAISPVTGSVAGASSAAPATSAAWTAYPSMLELSNDGRATAAVTSSASTHPSAAASSRLVGASGVIAEKDRRLIRLDRAQGTVGPGDLWRGA